MKELSQQSIKVKGYYVYYRLTLVCRLEFQIFRFGSQKNQRIEKVN